MDSGNEVIIVDDSIATTNGFNGNHEDASDMKTRSKAGEEDLSKPKLRSTRNATAAGGTDKVGSDTERKDAKKVVDVSSKKEPDSKSCSKEVTAAAAIASSVRNLPQDVKAVSVVVRKAKPGEEEKLAAVATVAAPLPKKKAAVDREDDSGINSRASSVSNEDATPRMRTRSSRTSEIASTSTPAYKKGHGRMPLSTYDFDDVTFDEDAPSPSSLKRKAVLYVEEMEEANDEDASEPLEKRPAVVALRSQFIDALLYPVRSLSWKLPAIRRRAANAADQLAAVDAPKTEALAEDIGKENIESPAAAAAAAAENAEASESTADPSTCRIM